MLTTSTISRRLLLACGAASLATSVSAKLAPLISVQSRDGLTITVKDLSPQFLDFYAAARDMAPDARFQTWREMYGFAAVPPTPQGDSIARKLLDAAWPQYASALSTIRAGAAGMRPAPLAIALSVADLLEAPRPIRFGLTAYVGGFETNAFTYGTANGPVIAAPIEMDEATRAVLLPHEMTHAIHMIVGHLDMGYERTLGRVIFEEGLAMRVVQRLRPGLAEFQYVGDAPWFNAAMAERRRILDQMLPHLEAKDGETVFKFTMGTGSTGRQREAYVAGWLVAGDLLRHGQTFPALARLPEAQLPAIVRDSINRMLAA
jgi:hypothetical protein